MKMSPLDSLATLLVVIGGVNWGLVALFETDLVGEVFGVMTTLAKVVYVLIAVSALYVGARAFMGMKKM